MSYLLERLDEARDSGMKVQLETRHNGTWVCKIKRSGNKPGMTEYYMATGLNISKAVNGAYTKWKRAKDA
jgi:hypothetical protein